MSARFLMEAYLLGVNKHGTESVLHMASAHCTSLASPLLVGFGTGVVLRQGKLNLPLVLTNLQRKAHKMAYGVRH